MKISLQRLFETSKLLATKAGQELTELVTFTSEFAEQTLRALRNGLTFGDNFNSKIAVVQLVSGVDQTINVNQKTPTDILLTRVFSTIYAVDSFLWYIDGAGNTRVKATFTGGPTAAITVRLVVLYE